MSFRTPSLSLFCLSFSLPLLSLIWRYDQNTLSMNMQKDTNFLTISVETDGVCTTAWHIPKVVHVCTHTTLRVFGTSAFFNSRKLKHTGSAIRETNLGQHETVAGRILRERGYTHIRIKNSTIICSTVWGYFFFCS